MASSSHFLLLVLTLISISHKTTCLSLRLPSDDRSQLYCESWRLSVETNNAGVWFTDPQCVNYVKEYVSGDRYLSDLEVVASDSLAFAETVNIVGDGMDAWVFDIDETLLSNFASYEQHGFGSKLFHESWKDEWANSAESPALNASLQLYNQLKDLGFTIFLLTGRNESVRESTVHNLKFAGYSDWKRLILRGPKDEGKPAIQYKSQKRGELIYEGYRIRGSCGDQWSDLLGYAVAERSFKLPNPVYYIA